jgi:hypothetical protein
MGRASTKKQPYLIDFIASNAIFHCIVKREGSRDQPYSGLLVRLSRTSIADKMREEHRR